MAKKHVIDLERFACLTGDIGYYTFKDASENVTDNGDDEMKAAYADLKVPLKLPAGTYELEMHARGFVCGSMKVTEATTPNDILCAMAKYFKGHTDTYLEELKVDTKKKIINSSFGT